MIRKLSLSTSAAWLLAGLTLTVPASAQQPTTKRYTSNFEVAITKRANPLQAPYQVVGELTIDLAADGTFTCQINPLKSVKEAPAPQTVLMVGGKFDPDGPASLKCGGQVTGRLIGIIIDMGDDYQIYGTGVLPSDLSKAPEGPIKMTFGGAATTSVTGESGDWKIRVCISVDVYDPFNGKTYRVTACTDVPFT